jgi:hypothetical protein
LIVGEAALMLQASTLARSVSLGRAKISLLSGEEMTA